MATYNIESFYRTTLQGTILASTNVADLNTAGFKVFNTPLGTYNSTNPGFVTVSPNTDNEEIFEFTAVDSVNKILTISKRGINKSSRTLTTNGAFAATGDYNNLDYMKSHTINDAVRGDINHIHINQNFSTIELASTANGKGASQVGIEDAGGYFTSTNMEGALQEALSVLAPNVKATASVYGVAKMSVAPVSSTDPIAVGDNDTRVSKKYCVATQAANQSFADNSGTTYAIDTYVTNDASMSATPGRIIIPTTGQYIVSGCVRFFANATGGRQAYVTKNGTSIYIMDLSVSSNGAGSDTSVSGSIVADLTAGDYILLRGLQNSGGALNVRGTVQYSYLSVAKL